MNEESLSAALRLLDDFLISGKAKAVWLVVGGGSALLIQRLSTRQTKDVDVMALREWEVPIATTRMIAAGAGGNVRAAMADLEMWLG